MTEEQAPKQLPFDEWFEENDATIIDKDAYQIAKMAWYAAIRWVDAEQIPFAWATEEEQPRLVNHRSKMISMPKAATKSFCIPLFAHPHHATKDRRDL